MIKLSSKCVKKFVITQEIEPRLPALIFYSITTTPLRTVYRIKKITNFELGLLACLQMGPGFESPWFSFQYCNIKNN